MPKLNVSVPHSLEKEEAARRLSYLMDGIKSKYANQVKILEEEFGETSGTFAFKTMGLTIRGTAEVTETDATINCDLPFAAMMVKGRIEKELRASLKKVLG